MKGATVSVHVFTLVLDQEPTDAQLDALVEAGCDDAAFGVEHGLVVAEFDREAPVLADAIAWAVRAVESTGLRALRVLDEDLLNFADIVDRIGRSRESIRRYATGERASGGFRRPSILPGRVRRSTGGVKSCPGFGSILTSMYLTQIPHSSWRISFCRPACTGGAHVGAQRPSRRVRGQWRADLPRTRCPQQRSVRWRLPLSANVRRCSHSVGDSARRVADCPA